MDIGSTLDVSAAGMDAQTTRLRVIAENLANQDTTGSTPGADPYRRKLVTFQDVIGSDQSDSVAVASVTRDQTPFEKRYEPSHPAADAQGYVKLPNVDSFVELMDMKEAERSYSANLNVMQVARSMLARTLELLR
jgi:flagellar basal-body rod protein FlgC